MKQKIVHIVGPTAVGKTALSLNLARKFDGILISADSVQVYKGLDIISGKDIPQDSKFHLVKKFSSKFDLGYYDFSNIKVYLLDVVAPSYSFSVYDFLKISKELLELVLVDQKIPIIVGGTGLYSEKFISGLDDFGNVNSKFREKLQNQSLEELQKMLKKINPEKYKSLNNSDINNPRRLIRAIEIIVNKQSLPSEEGSKKELEKSQSENLRFDALSIGLMCNRDELKKRIDIRVDERMRNGALKEAEDLFVNYESLSGPVKNANGYKQLFKYLNKEYGFEEAIYRWKISEYRHAKNQMTWFRKYGNVKWFDITEKGFEKDINKEISSFLS